MNHLPYIVAAYLLAGAVILWLSLGAALRTAQARRRLLAVDPRAGGAIAGGPYDRDPGAGREAA